MQLHAGCLPIRRLPRQENGCGQNRVRVALGEIADRSLQAAQRNTSVVVSQVLGLQRICHGGKVGGGEGENSTHDKIESCSGVEEAIAVVSQQRVVSWAVTEKLEDTHVGSISTHAMQ